MNPRATTHPGEMVTAEFTVPACVGGSSADLVAEFVSWVPLPMDLLADGSFAVTIRLDADRRWRYRFLVDGERWMNDFDADDYVGDPNGECWSVIVT